MEKLRAEVQPRFDREIEQMQSEVDALLTPEQRDRWHEWVQNLRHRWGPHRPRHGSHGPRDKDGHRQAGRDADNDDDKDREKSDQKDAAKAAEPAPAETSVNASAGDVENSAGDNSAGEKVNSSGDGTTSPAVEPGK